VKEFNRSGQNTGYHHPEVDTRRRPTGPSPSFEACNKGIIRAVLHTIFQKQLDISYVCELIVNYLSASRQLGIALAALENIDGTNLENAASTHISSAPEVRLDPTIGSSHMRRHCGDVCGFLKFCEGAENDGAVI
jgi:hypothetical protein